jgi:hypothetical protein
MAEKNTKKNQNSDTLNPQPEIAYPLHNTLGKQEDSHATRCQLETSLKDADQDMSKNVAGSICTAITGINQHHPLDRLTTVLQKKLNNK